VSDALQHVASSRSPRGGFPAIGALCLTLLTPLRAIADEPISVPVREGRPAAWIGVWLGDAVDGGVEIVALVPGGPAQRAGLKPGDIIIEANQAAVTDRDVLRQALMPLAPGDSLRLVLMRSGDLVRRTLDVDRRSGAVFLAPGSGRAPSARDEARIALLRAELLGLQVTEITPELRRHYGAPEDAGVLVIGTAFGDLLGIRVGDVLLRIGNRKIVRPGQLAWFSSWTSGESVQFEIVRDRERTTLTVDQGTVAPALSDPGILGESGRSSEDRERVLLRNRLEREIERLEKRLEQLRSELNKQGEPRNR